MQFLKMKHTFENSKNTYYTIKVISTNKNAFSIFSSLAAYWIMVQTKYILASKQVLYSSNAQWQNPDSSSGAHSSISRTLDLKGIIIFLSSAYAFLNYKTRHVIKFTLSGWSLFLVWHILLVTYPAIPPPSLTKTPFSSGDGEHSSRIEIKIGLSQNGIHCSTLPITNVAVCGWETQF